VYGAGIQAAALEYFDGGTLTYAGAAFPGGLPAESGFLVIAEADGSEAEAERVAGELSEALAEGALTLLRPEPEELWRWRDGVSHAVTAATGAKQAEDVAVPVEYLLEIVTATVEVGEQHGLRACSWGHAGDGNVHASFLLPPGVPEEAVAAEAAADELGGRAIALGGTVAAEHGLGSLKAHRLGAQLGPRLFELQSELKHLFDPKGLLNPGKKVGP
jgi:FAD/FMN-containing dehydrogenase